MSEIKRKIPRHVDGRIKIGLMPIKSFFMFLPFAILILIITFRFISPITMFIGVAVLGSIGGLFCEFQNKETGIDLLRDKIRYAKQGDKFFERSREYVSFTANQRCNRD